MTSGITKNDHEGAPIHQPKPGLGPAATWITALAGVLILGILGGFIVGLHVGKTTARIAPGAFGGFGQRSMGRLGAFGTVTAVSSNSITINDDREGTTRTFSITNTTTITRDGSSAKASDITVGDSVIVQTRTSSTSGDSTATSIRINPPFPGRPSSSENSGAADSSNI